MEYNKGKNDLSNIFIRNLSVNINTNTKKKKRK